MLIGAHDPTLGGNRVDDAKAVLVEERVELAAEGSKSARLHLDELAVGPHDVDHEALDRHLQAIAGLG